jgi:hypothetical protein
MPPARSSLLVADAWGQRDAVDVLDNQPDGVQAREEIPPFNLPFSRPKVGLGQAGVNAIG